MGHVGDAAIHAIAKLLLVETGHQQTTSESKAYVARPAAPAAAYKGQRGAGSKQEFTETD